MIIVYVTAESVAAQCDQRAKLLSTERDTATVKLLGTDEVVSVNVRNICGLELDEHCRIKFSSVTQVCITY
jgi:hypothetical protein